MEILILSLDSVVSMTASHKHGVRYLSPAQSHPSVLPAFVAAYSARINIQAEARSNCKCFLDTEETRGSCYDGFHSVMRATRIEFATEIFT